MEQKTAPMSMTIRIVTGFVIAMAISFIYAGWFEIKALLPAGLLVLVIAACFLTAPTGYSLEDGILHICRRVGRKACGRVTGCGPLVKNVGMGFRLWGNGGLFAGTGLHWNRKLGLFRAYVTSARTADLVLVETDNGKVIISPADPEAFTAACRAGHPG